MHYVPIRRGGRTSLRASAISLGCALAVALGAQACDAVRATSADAPRAPEEVRLATPDGLVQVVRFLDPEVRGGGLVRLVAVLTNAAGAPVEVWDAGWVARDGGCDPQ